MRLFVKIKTLIWLWFVFSVSHKWIDFICVLMCMKTQIIQIKFFSVHKGREYTALLSHPLILEDYSMLCE